MIYIHVGFPKTATTFLQRDLFHKLPGIVYLGRDYARKQSYHPDIKNIIRDLCQLEEIMFDVRAYRKAFSPLIENAATEGKNLLMSDERLTLSNIFTGRHVIAKRLRELFNDQNVRIIFTIRNQIAASVSLYIYVNAILPFPVWINNKIREQDLFKPNPLHTFLYYEVIKYYEDLFGKENIRILLQEDLKENKNNFLEQLKDVFDIGNKDLPVSLNLSAVQNPKQTSSARLFTKLCNLFLPSVLDSRFRECGYYRNIINMLNRFGKSPQIHISEEVMEILQDMFKEGNNKLKKEYNLPLEKYGYPM